MDMKKIVFSLLVWLTRFKIWLVKPTVIGITGSVGKTSTKEIVAAVLAQKYRVLKSEGNFNTEFGLCLSVLRISSTPTIPIGWAWIIIRALFNTFFRSFPYDYVVLEYGIDKPGDMETLVSILKPDISIITRIVGEHLDEGQFNSVADIWQEKRKILTALTECDTAITNSNDPLQTKFLSHFSGPIMLSYGENKNDTVYASSISDSLDGLTITLHPKQQEEYTVTLPHVIGVHHASLALIAATIAHHAHISADQVISALKTFRLPPGRMSRIKGIHGSLIIDSSYNASPTTMKAALDTLSQFPGRKIAVLGQMNELGQYTQQAHEEVGNYVEGRADILVTIAKGGTIYATVARKKKSSSLSHIYSFNASAEAGEFLKGFIKKGDVILVKGSQNGVRTERVVKAIMQHPEKAATLLIRQGKQWRNL